MTASREQKGGSTLTFRQETGGHSPAVHTAAAEIPGPRPRCPFTSAPPPAPPSPAGLPTGSLETGRHPEASPGHQKGVYF